MTYVFDLDGTLIDSKKRHYLLMAELLKKKNIVVSESFADDFLRYKADGKSGLNYLVNVIGLTKKESEEINQLWISNIEKDYWLNSDVLFYDAIETCEKCIENGIEIVFVTCRHNQSGTLHQLNALGLTKYAKEIFIIDPLKQDKNTTVKKITATTKIDLIVGDTEVDYKAALSIDCLYYILNRGFRSKKYWDKMNVLSYENLSELPIWRIV